MWRFPVLSETFIVNQVVLAIRLGYDVQILVEEQLDISKNSSSQLFREYAIEEKIIKEDYRIPQNKITRFLKAGSLIISNPSMFRVLGKFYRASNKKGLLPLYQLFFYNQFRNHEVVHIQFGTNKYPVDVLKQIGFLKSRLIVSFHGHDLYFPINNKIPNNGYYDVLFKEAYVLVCNTVFLKSKLLSLEASEKKIRVIPVVVNTDKFQPKSRGSETGKFTIITVGRIDELKGQKYGIGAIAKLVQKGYNIQYFLAGDGPNRIQLKERVKELQLEDHVVQKGKVSQQKVLQLLQRSHVFLMTSVKNTAGMEESQGLVTAEAQACGLPVVAFNSGGVKYTLKDGVTGFLCQEKDIEALAEKIELLIKDSELRKKMGDNAVKFIEREYSERSVRKKWKEIYG